MNFCMSITFFCFKGDRFTRGLEISCKFNAYTTRARIHNSTLLYCNVPNTANDDRIGENVSVTLIYGTNRDVVINVDNNWLSWIDVIRLEALSRSVGTFAKRRFTVFGLFVHV